MKSAPSMTITNVLCRQNVVKYGYVVVKTVVDCKSMQFKQFYYLVYGIFLELIKYKHVS